LRPIANALADTKKETESQPAFSNPPEQLPPTPPIIPLPNQPARRPPKVKPPPPAPKSHPLIPDDFHRIPRKERWHSCSPILLIWIYRTKSITRTPSRVRFSLGDSPHSGQPPFSLAVFGLTAFRTGPFSAGRFSRLA
jgi:hypothetical protein